METKNLTIMFTDIKGFSTLTSLKSREQIHTMLETQEKLIRPIIDQSNGVVIKTVGDAYLVTFESPTDAVLCGMKIQHALCDHNSSSDKDLCFLLRIAINSGEVNLKDGDVFGEPVNIASRIEAIAEPGEIYFTESVYLAMNKNEIPTAEVGTRYLKGIPEQIRVYKVLKEDSALLKTRAERQKRAELTSGLDKEKIYSGDPKTSKSTSDKLFWSIWAVFKYSLLIGITVVLTLIIVKNIVKKNIQNNLRNNISTLKKNPELIKRLK